MVTKDKVEVHSTVCLVRRCDCIKETPRPMHRTVIVSEPKSGEEEKILYDLVQLPTLLVAGQECALSVPHEMLSRDVA